MMLTTKGRYAVMALVDMANQNRFIENNEKAISLSEIAKRQDITVAYLEQIFSKLKNAGIVRSQRGPGGGYVFAKDIKDIKISEVINAAEEKIKMTRCGGEHSHCKSGGKCETHDLWDGLGETIEQYFDSKTLDDIVNKKLGIRDQGQGTREKNLASGPLSLTSLRN